MIRFLFPRLTRDEKRGQALFAALVAEARQPHWYIEGGVEDSLDGRFAVLSTLVALATVWLEQKGRDGEAAAVALAERFVEAMDAEHRQLGLGDPTLGKTVRKLMGALGRKVALWRGVVEGQGTWRAATEDSLLRGSKPAAAAIDHDEQALRGFWEKAHLLPVDQESEGRRT
ncbi:MAG TPA: ubiquinol-cytochrome C chaperone family protein [Sphingomicrobium sp.]|nr:ubiquinol-cytochrome C chaperone family protein [Sphingomicrobium sp.]